LVNLSFVYGNIGTLEMLAQTYHRGQIASIVQVQKDDLPMLRCKFCQGIVEKIKLDCESQFEEDVFVGVPDKRSSCTMAMAWLALCVLPGMKPCLFKEV
jgi:hypothetical protein